MSDEPSLEERLRERGRRRADQRWLGAEAEAALRMQLQAEAASARPSPRWPAWTMLAAALVLALVWFGSRSPAPDRGALAVQVALLDEEGREVGSGRRAGEEAFEPPETFLLEVVPADDGWLAVRFVDPRGVVRDPDAGASHRLEAERDFVRRYALNEYRAPERGVDSVLTVLLVASRREIPPAALDRRLPRTVAADDLERVARELRESFGCTVVLRPLTLDRR